MKVCSSVPDSWIETTSSERSPVLRKPCGVSGGTDQDLIRAQLHDGVAGRPAPLPSRTMNVSEYGCTWRSTALPGGVRYDEEGDADPGAGTSLEE